MKAPSLPIAALVAALTMPAWGAAQETLISGLDMMEGARSRSCVTILASLDTLDLQLLPLAERSQRLQVIGSAMSIEERSIVESLNAADSTEAAVQAWFASDLALAQQYVDTQNEALLTRRSNEREAMLQRVRDEIIALQAEGQAHIAAAGELAQTSGMCDGAILVRPVVVEACAGQSTPLCDDARSGEPSERYRFVPSAQDLWDVSEFRPWTDPAPIQLSPEGQIVGASTVAYARQGNVALTMALGPLIQGRAELTAEQVTQLEAIVDSLGFEFSHPDLVFAPSLGLRTVLPEALAGESLYVLHFGDVEEAAVLWTAPTGPDPVIDATIVLNPEHVGLLASGAPIHFTGVAEAEDGTSEAVFSIQFTPVNQARAAGAVFGYMASQMSTDLAALAIGGGGD